MANNSIIITSEYFVGALDHTHLCAILFGKLERFGQDWDREAVTEIKWSFIFGKILILDLYGTIL